MSSFKPLYCLYISIGIISTTLLFTTSAHAQIVPDKTLPNNSRVNLNGNIRTIVGGTTRGTNLFHSFKEFSVPTGSTAFFNHAPNIQNIISRVTGNSISNIDGLIKASDKANIFLINPNGIIFGQNAKLNIGGSFFATSANSMKFADGSEFSTTNPQAPPLLTINEPIGLQFGNNPGNIEVQKDALPVKPNQTLGLVGGDIKLQGATLEGTGGRIELGSVGNNSFVSLTPITKGFTLGYDGVKNFGNIQLLQQTSVHGGDININTGSLSLANATIDTSISGGDNNKPSSAGKIIINALGAVNIDNNSSVNAGIEPGANGTGGDIDIKATSFLLSNNSQIDAFVNDYAKGTAGNISIDVGNGNFTIKASPNSDVITGIFSTLGNGAARATISNAQGSGGSIKITSGSLSIIGTTTSTQDPNAGIAAKTFGFGDAGKIQIDTGNILIENGGFIDNSTTNTGNAGAINITAQDSITLKNDSLNRRAIQSRVQSGRGNGGDIKIKTGLLSLDNANIDTGLSRENPNAPIPDGKATGGNIDIKATSFLLSNSQIDAFVNDDAKGIAGDISIDVGNGKFTIQASSNSDVITGIFDTLGNGAAGATISTAQGSGGNIKITSGSLSIIGNSTSSTEPSGGIAAKSFGVGDAGSIQIDTGTLSIENGGFIDNSTTNTGNAGSINIMAQDSITLKNDNPNRRAIQSSVQKLGIGNGGDIKINTRSLSLDHASINANADTNGESGNINLLPTELLLLRHGSNITTNANGTKNTGGNIKIDSGVLAVLEDSRIAADSTQNKGGQVIINTQGSFGTESWYTPDFKGNITAKGSTPQLNGTVQINTRDVDPSNGLVKLPVHVVDYSRQISNACTPGTRKFRNTFVATGRSGLPLNPIEPLQDQNTLSAWVKFKAKPQKETIKTIMETTSKVTAKTPIVEASGWVVDGNGNIELVARDQQMNFHKNWKVPASCSVSQYAN